MRGGSGAYTLAHQPFHVAVSHWISGKLKGQGDSNAALVTTGRTPADTPSASADSETTVPQRKLANDLRQQDKNGRHSTSKNPPHEPCDFRTILRSDGIAVWALSTIFPVLPHHRGTAKSSEKAYIHTLLYSALQRPPNFPPMSSSHIHRNATVADEVLKFVPRTVAYYVHPIASRYYTLRHPPSCG
ncbi:hypothetical protein FA13DRAFT_1712159 [Coprinellus micaceus]|uniref:Uncharacterized protein n=1 Tax=Coprinellus micaceus TaxID=71717 RepID=A0A4Y7T1N9_COPMI|nr:hypothetical protein FA13DRAFT_1712159 [Coprinellus micaceus]